VVNPTEPNFFNQKGQRVVKGFSTKIDFSQQGREGHKEGVFLGRVFLALLCSILLRRTLPILFSQQGSKDCKD
jgi:hypothetical protein